MKLPKWKHTHMSEKRKKNRACKNLQDNIKISNIHINYNFRKREERKDRRNI